MNQPDACNQNVRSFFFPVISRFGGLIGFFVAKLTFTKLWHSLDEDEDEYEDESEGEVRVFRPSAGIAAVDRR